MSIFNQRISLSLYRGSLLTSGYLDDKANMIDVWEMKVEFVKKPHSIQDLLSSFAKVLNK